MKKHKNLLLIGIMMCLSLTASAKDDSWQLRASGIVKGCTSEYDKAKAIYEWVCKNIDYDLSSEVFEAETCWKCHKGTCAAYSRLYVPLARGAGLEADTIRGNSKTLLYTSGIRDHALVKVFCDNRWLLADPTWGAGGIVFDNMGNYHFNHQYHSYWFDVDPAWMIFTHYPFTQSNQLLEKPLTAQQYATLPMMEPDMGEWGWDAHKALTFFLTHPKTAIPTLYNISDTLRGKMQFIEVPMTGRLKIKKPYRFVVKMLMDNAEPYLGPNVKWTRNGDTYTTTLTPSSKDKNYKLGIKLTRGQRWSVQSIMQYTVK